MTDTKHTPAPWTAAASMVSGAVKNSVFAGPHGNCILATVCDPFQENNEVAEANARLIAAAPELLQALKDMLEMHGPRGGNIVWDGPYDAARAAIAKAGSAL